MQDGVSQLLLYTSGSESVFSRIVTATFGIIFKCGIFVPVLHLLNQTPKWQCPEIHVLRRSQIFLIHTKAEKDWFSSRAHTSDPNRRLPRTHFTARTHFKKFFCSMLILTSVTTSVFTYLFNINYPWRNPRRKLACIDHLFICWLIKTIIL
jgi:hypothetical protein